MEVKAHLNYLRIAPRKVRLVAKLLIGMPAKRAELELRNLSKRSALPLLKLLRSAMSNAKHNFELLPHMLRVKKVTVDAGPMFKRTRARAFGRAALIQKKTSHISLVLETTGIDGSSGRKKTDSTRKKTGQIIREAGMEDKVGKEVRLKGKSESPVERRPVSSKPADFVRRVFRRKAI